ncbi:MAG: MFS transporter [Puniceicoccales bacterium]|jgi:LPLT family lysophospholipid transporter-like MFS transporter|nr:MFS transporter [Puniceicoccales bacterium]
MPKKRDYPLLLSAQFLSAFGDNAILAIIIGPLTFQASRGEISESVLRDANTLYTVLLFVPCVIFAPLAGYFNDRFPKTSCLVAGNAFKLTGAILCTCGLWWTESLFQGVGYFIIGAGTCLYGPAKYGVLPEILPRAKLVHANGVVEMLTLIAVLAGFGGGAKLADTFDGQRGIPFALILGTYAIALVLNMFMSRTYVTAPDAKLRQCTSAFFQHAWSLLRSPRPQILLLGSAMFWFVGAAMKSHFNPWGISVLKLRNNTEISLLVLAMSIGVMAGGLLAGRLHKVGDLRKTPWNGFALAIVFILTWIIGHNEAFLHLRINFFDQTLILPVSTLVAAAGIFAGLFLIPLNAALQAESDPAKTGKTIATQNFLDYLGMCLASVYLLIANKINISPNEIFLGLAIVAVVISRIMLRSGKLAPGS